MANAADTLNALATTEQVVGSFLTSVQAKLLELRQEIDALRQQVATGDPGAQQAFDAVTTRLNQLTARVRDGMQMLQ